jgi:hypothetical protein
MGLHPLLGPLPEKRWLEPVDAEEAANTSDPRQKGRPDLAQDDDPMGAHRLGGVGGRQGR